MWNRRGFVVAITGFVAAPLLLRASGGPKQVLLLRHAEKNDTKTDRDLKKRGLMRAAALPRLFPASFDTPDFLFASKPSTHSNRPVETITPLARALHLAINSSYEDGACTALAHEVLSNPRYAAKTVLICWHHGNIPRLAASLGIAQPPHWPDKQFDRIWKIEYGSGGATLTNLPQHLLDGDSELL